MFLRRRFEAAFPRFQHNAEQLSHQCNRNSRIASRNVLIMSLLVGSQREPKRIGQPRDWLPTKILTMKPSRTFTISLPP